MTMNQNDFRRMLASGARNPEVVQESSSPAGALPAVPKAAKDKSKFYKPRAAKKVDGEEEWPRWSQNYRDRAAERRSTATEHMQEDDKMVQNLDYEQSKFLGGDFAHTHLVKGLDFALLKKMRSELPPTEEAEKEDMAPSHVAQTAAAGSLHDAAATGFSTTRGAAIVAALGTMQATAAARTRGTFSQSELTRALQGKPTNGNEDFLPGRWVFEVILDPHLEADGIALCIRRSREDAPAYDPLLVDPGLPERLYGSITSLAMGKVSRKALDRYGPATQAPISHGVSSISQQVAQADLRLHNVKDDDCEDIFSGLGTYSGPSEVSPGAANVDVLTQFSAIPDYAGGFMAGPQDLDLESTAVHLPVSGAVPVAGDRTAPASGTKHTPNLDGRSAMLEIIDDADEDDGLAITRSRAGWASRPTDFEGEAFKSVAAAPRQEGTLLAASDSIAGLRVASKAKQDPAAGQKRGRKDITADVPPAEARFASLGGDTAAPAGSKLEHKASCKNSATTSLESYEHRIAKGGSWLAAMHKDEDGHKDRAKKRNKMDAQLQQIQALMAERRAGTVKGAIAGFGAGAEK